MSTNNHVLHNDFSELDGTAPSYSELQAVLITKDKILNEMIEKINRSDERISSDPLLTELKQIILTRNHDLESKNLELESAQATLSAAQTELYQAQKLESIGRLAAGVAHEINTPIQFIGDNIHFMGEGLTDLAGFFAALDDLITEQSVGLDTVQKLADIKEKFDIEYLLQNIPLAIERSADGIARVAEIVQSMKSFSHPDRSIMRITDLNAGIVTTLAIAKNEYKYVAKMVTEFGELPMVECLGGEINQVFLNLVINAAHAIEEANKGTSNLGTITIRTRQSGENVIAEISDTGCGIPESAQASIFDQFFTTKEVGKGTGQGLSIARQVISQKHGGEIWFETVPGTGTTFFISLPIVQKEKQDDLAA